MNNVWDTVKNGQERIATCRDCRCTSAGDVRGLGAFTYVLRGGGCIEVCKDCALVDQWGNVAFMAKLIKETKSAPKSRLQLEPQFESVKVHCFGATATAAPSDETWVIR